MIPIYINVRDYGSPAALLVEYLRQIPEARPIIVDNASTWPALLDWYTRAPCEVIRLHENRGPRAPLTVLDETREGATHYVMTDGDLDLARVPLDVPELQPAAEPVRPARLRPVPILRFDRQHTVAEGIGRRDVLQREGQADFPALREFVEAGAQHVQHAAIDTTFCMLRAADPYTAYEPALRADRPYTARHVPWYMTEETTTPEYLYYLDHLEHRGGVYWSTLAADRRTA